jgi:hypothetical protein
MILGYLIMTSRTTGESAYTARAVTPRFVVGATLSVLGIFLASVLAQFVTATDLAMVGVSMPGNAVGGADAWPAAGGVFEVLQKASFDPRMTEGPNNWNDGAWLSAGLAATVLMTFLQMVNAALSAVERLLILVGPICLAAYASAGDPADHERLAEGPARDPPRALRLDDRLRPVQPPGARPHRSRRQPTDHR